MKFAFHNWALSYFKFIILEVVAPMKDHQNNLL